MPRQCASEYMLTNFMVSDVCGDRDKRFDSVGQVVRLIPALQRAGKRRRASGQQCEAPCRDLWSH
jgi:hypothetical protein